MGKRVADMTPEELERKRSRDRKGGMTPEQLERRRAGRRVESLTLEQIERNRAKKWVGNMTSKQLDRKRAGDRMRSLTTEQLDRKRLLQCSLAAEVNAKKAPDIEVFMLNKIDVATRRLKCTCRIPSICPPELAAKLAPVLEMLKTADAAQRAVVRGVVRTMRAARELELAESVIQ